MLLKSETPAKPASTVSPVLKIRSDERGLIAGATGSGKSTLAPYLLRDKKFLVIVDPKGDFNSGFEQDEIAIVRDPAKLQAAAQKVDIIVYRPQPEFDSVSDYDRVFEWIYRRKNCFVYIDEVALVVNGPTVAPRFLRAIYQQGRGLGIGCIAVTQRPAGVPIFLFSESSKFWIFRLLVDSDLDRVSQWMGGDFDRLYRQTRRDSNVSVWSERHSFWYRDVYGQGAKQYILKRGKS